MKLIFTLLVLSCSVLFLSAQEDHLSQNEKIDNLFAKLNYWDSPGAAVAVIQNGEVIYKRGYGSANLEGVKRGHVFILDRTLSFFFHASPFINSNRPTYWLTDAGRPIPKRVANQPLLTELRAFIKPAKITLSEADFLSGNVVSSIPALCAKFFSINSHSSSLAS